MSLPRPPRPAKLVISLLMQRTELITPVVNDLIKEMGAIDIVSSWMPFDYTHYYETEMGTPLRRRVITFKRLIEQDALADIKLSTNKIEQRFAVTGQRKINIDPGYLLRSRFILATGKNYAHRIYLGKGIYADLTLIFQKGAFRKLPWTYPDYAAPGMLTCLMDVRRKYVEDFKAGKCESGNLSFQKHTL